MAEASQGLFPTSSLSPTNGGIRRRPDLAPIKVGLSIDRSTNKESSRNTMPSSDDDIDNPPTPPPKTPYTPPKTPYTAMPILSDYSREEEELEKAQTHTDKEQLKDLKVKTRVRMAKYLLRGVNFSCSLIVLSMLSTSLTIFRATKDLPPRFVGTKPLTPWAKDQKIWPQLVVLVISCLSLAIAIVALWRYRRGPNRRARRADWTYNFFAMGSWLFSLAMWLLGASVLQHARNSSGNQDFWGWSCLQNTRSKIYSDQIKYSLVCRLQSWSLVCCIIEVVVEAITLGVYGVIAYRFWSKRRLTKAMHRRNEARGEVYAAQLRRQQSDWEGEGIEMTPQYAVGDKKEPEAFVLQPVPGKGTAAADEPGMQSGIENRRSHVGAAPGETVYDSVPIPEAYPR